MKTLNNPRNLFVERISKVIGALPVQVRWIFVIPTAIAAGYIVSILFTTISFLVTVVAFSTGYIQWDSSFHQKEMEFIGQLITLVSLAVSTFSFVYIGTLVAPKYKPLVSVLLLAWPLYRLVQMIIKINSISEEVEGAKIGLIILASSVIAGAIAIIVSLKSKN